jgi:hypothetical protein
MTTIPFEITQDEYTFRDAIVLPEGVTMTEDEIETMKQQRFDDWVTLITTVEEIIQE